MTRITIPDDLSSQIRAATGPIEFVDEHGITVATAKAPSQNDNGCPYTPEELAVMRAQPGGKTLQEIWMSLGAK